MCLWFI